MSARLQGHVLAMTIKMEILCEGVRAAPLDLVMLSLVTFMTALSLLIIYTLLMTSASSKDNIPGPPAITLFSLFVNLTEVVKNWGRILDCFHEYNTLYAGEDGLGCWKFNTWVGQPDFIVTLDPKNIERILTKTDIYGKGPILRRK